ncbi:hypothetical protein Tco_0336584, partial [Tanacetum coccineum]
CKQAEKVVPLQAKQADWLEDTDEEIDEQEEEAHYSFMAKIQEYSEQSKSTSNTCLLEKDDSNVTLDSPDMCDNDIQTDQNAKDERAALANLITNLKLDVDENKKIQKELVHQAWEKHSHNHFHAPTAHDMEYVESLENEIDELESDKAEFSNMYDILLQQCMSNDVMYSYLHSLSDLDAHFELQCLYLHKVKECECIAQKLLKQTKSVSKEVYTELLRSFDKLEKHSISLELALQQSQEQMKNDTLCKEKASNVFKKEREQYFEIQDLKAQLQDKNIAISELKKLIEKCKGKFMETKFDKSSSWGNALCNTNQKSTST